MKKRTVFFIPILLLLLAIATTSVAQQLPYKQTIGTKQTMVVAASGIRADSLFQNTIYADTATANFGVVSRYPGTQIQVGDSIWVRNAAATGWINYGRGGGSYTLAADSLTGWALDFDNTKGQNVYHGYFWPSTDSFLRFFNDTWIQPESDGGTWTGYYVSCGYGGSHFFLGGVAASSTTFYPTGNVYPGTGSISDFTWVGADVLPIGTLHHIAVGYDSTRIVVFVDGVPSGEKAFTSWRKVTGGSDVQWYTGGSDHSNFNGKILRMRHFEDNLPIQLRNWFYPQWQFNGYMPSEVLNADYTSVTNIIEDHSPGFWGVKHPGIRNSIIPGEFPFAGVANSVITTIDGRPDSLLPQWTKYNFAKPTYTGGSPTIPGSAIIYDEFARADISPAWNFSPNLDSTEGGTAGKKKYFFKEATGSGIINKQAWLQRSGGSVNYCYVETGVSDQDVRVEQTIGDKTGGIVARWTDDNNYILVQPSGATMYINKVVAGVTTTLSTYSKGTYTTLRLTLSGGNWEVFEDATSKASGTSIGDVPLGTKAGFMSTGFYERFDKWAVY